MRTHNYYIDVKTPLKEQLDLPPVSDETVLIQLFSGMLDEALLKGVLHELRELFPTAVIVGATTDGEICNGYVSTDNIILSISYFSYSTCRSMALPIKTDSFQTGRLLAEGLAQPRSKVMLLFSDGMVSNGDDLLKGVALAAPDLPVAGGMAGDNARFEKTYVFHNDDVLTESVVAVVIDSDHLQVWSDYSFHWQPIGKEHVITRAEKNIVYSIDDMDALEFYTTYLGVNDPKELSAIAVRFPLMMERDGMVIGRAAHNVNPEVQSIHFSGNIPEGARVRFGYGNTEIILSHAPDFNAQVQKSGAESLFIYSCMARRRFMPASIQQEIMPLQNLAPVAGFFTYGEFFHRSGRSELMNETMTILALSEAKSKEPIEGHNGFYSEDSDHQLTLKALNHLIQKTTEELSIENRKLEARVDEEVRLRRYQEDQLIQKSRLIAMGEMMGNIAHQWRQPINVIGLWLQEMADHVEEGEINIEEVRMMERKAMEQIEYLSRTIDDFRNFFKTSKKREPFSVKELLRKTFSLVESSLYKEGIGVVRECEFNQPVTGYPNEFSQALLNIFNNARDVLVERKVALPSITIRGWEEPSYTVIEIEDNAGGMDESVQERVFDPYFTTKHQSVGTGLGLYMSRTIIETNMGGSLTVRNGEHGACFVIQLRR